MDKNIAKICSVPTQDFALPSSIKEEDVQRTNWGKIVDVVDTLDKTQGRCSSGKRYF